MNIYKAKPQDINNWIGENYKCHLVTCGDCGSIETMLPEGGTDKYTSLIDAGYGEDNQQLYECPRCGFEGEASDFPDFIY